MEVVNSRLPLAKGFESTLLAASYSEAGWGDLISHLKQTIQNTPKEEWENMK